MIGAPVFHVNGDDPEACVWVAKLAVEYRQRWHNDVVIDMLCYRRRGHNEGDDPSMTQPSMYDIIDAKRSVRKIYTESLIGRGDISVEEAEHALKDFSNQLEHVFREVRELEKAPPAVSESVEARQVVPTGLDTAIPLSTVHRIGDVHAELPDRFTIHSRVKPVFARRVKMSREGDVDWAFGELLALGSLAMEGKLIRLSGQDSRRGTFTQRHAVAIDSVTGAEYVPLNHLADDQERFLPYDSALSEFAAVGFEYGYSVGNPDALVLWEAQFGDFANGAQSVIDEFISSGEAKWGQHSDVVLLLPHGLEGQGPDHSSGRIERFLQLCAEGSMTVALPSEPANYFHLLRRHALDRISRPLVVFTPKSMLRNKAAVSPLPDFTGGRFREVIDDPRYRENDGPAAEIHRILLCSGKIYWELAAARDKRPRMIHTATTPRSCGSSSSTRCRTASSRPSSSATRTPTTCAGCRKSRRTRARGPTSGSSCRRSCPSGWPGSSGSRAGGWPHPHRGRRRSTRSSRPISSTWPLLGSPSPHALRH